MKASELLKYVAKAAAVVDNNCLVPIAKNLLFKGNWIQATDLQTSINVSTPFGFGDPIAVDSQKLVAILKALKNQEIEFDLGFPVTSISTKNGEYEISAYDGNDFPPIKFGETENKTKAYILQRAVELTEKNISDDGLRPVMTGVYFDAEQGYVVATNGHKLGRYQSKFDESFILPAAAFPLIKNFEDKEVFYGASDNNITFATEGVIFSVRKIDGNYPPYQKVIPTENNKTLTIEQSELLTAAKRVGLFASQESSSIILELGDIPKIKGQDINYGNKAEEDLLATYEGASMTIGVNGKYLIELLNTSGEGTLDITFSEPNRPVLITNRNNPRYLQLVMPVSI